MWKIMRRDVENVVVKTKSGGHLFIFEKSNKVWKVDSIIKAISAYYYCLNKVSLSVLVGIKQFCYFR